MATRGSFLRRPLVWLFLIIPVVLTAAAIWWGLLYMAEVTWSYRYSDEGGDIVFTTRKFDLVLEGRRWPDGNGVTEGEGVLLIGGPVRIRDSGAPEPTLVGTNRCRLSFPDMRAYITERGRFLEIAGERIPLPDGVRVEIRVGADDVVSVRSPESVSNAGE